MFKGYFNRTSFIKARLAQSVMHRAKNLKVVGSSPTVHGQEFAFSIMLASPIQIKSSMTFIRGIRCKEKILVPRRLV